MKVFVVESKWDSGSQVDLFESQSDAQECAEALKSEDDSLEIAVYSKDVQ